MQCRLVLWDTRLRFSSWFRPSKSREPPSGWLHRVAYRVAMQSQADAVRRRARERDTGEAAVVTGDAQEPHEELRALLHAEIGRLPDRLRLPVVLCDLEGLTYEQAAGCLHWTVPALGCRLAKARKRTGGSHPARPDAQGVLPADEPGNSGASPI